MLKRRVNVMTEKGRVCPTGARCSARFEDNLVLIQHRLDVLLGNNQRGRRLCNRQME